MPSSWLACTEAAISPPVWIPDTAHEALRNLVRSRGDAKADALRAKHRLGKFLLPQGEHPPVGVRSWSSKYDTSLNQVRFEHRADQVVFEDYRAVMRAAVERVRRLETALMQCADTSPQVPMIAALQAFRGIGLLTAGADRVDRSRNQRGAAGYYLAAPCSFRSPGP